MILCFQGTKFMDFWNDKSRILYGIEIPDCYWSVRGDEYFVENDRACKLAKPKVNVRTPAIL